MSRCSKPQRLLLGRHYNQETMMNRAYSCIWGIIGLLALQPLALAEKSDNAAGKAASATLPLPPPPRPGAETKALGPITGNYTWGGSFKAGTLIPGSDDLPTKGKQRCKWIQNRLWAECDIEDSAGGVTWIGHLQVGWDFDNKTYRMLIVDNFGVAYSLVGKLDAGVFVFETAQEQIVMGRPTKIRFVYDATDPKNIKFSDLRSVAGAPFRVLEEDVFKKVP
jgi:hypothetical protein